MSTLHIPVGRQDHVLGPQDAPVTLVEYGDYQCSYCGEAYPVVKEILNRYENRIRFVFRNFPIPELHPMAMSAAETAEYAGSQGEFWQAHDALYENQELLGERLYVAIAEQLGLSAEGVESAVGTEEFGARITADINGGIRSGVNGTPAFYVNGSLYNVQGSFADLVTPIEQALGRS